MRSNRIPRIGKFLFSAQSDNFHELRDSGAFAPTLAALYEHLHRNGLLDFPCLENRSDPFIKSMNHEVMSIYWEYGNNLSNCSPMRIQYIKNKALKNAFGHQINIVE
jgi:hypothetical protein